MAFELPGLPKLPGLKVTSTGDCSTSQYYFVKLVSSGEVDVAASSDIPIGVIQNDASGGVAAEVLPLGITKVVAGSTIKAGKEVGVDANGKAEEFSKTEGEYKVGLALTSASAAGDIIPITINCLLPEISEMSSI